MKLLKIKYVDFWSSFKLEDDLLYNILCNSDKYKVEISDDPDYLIYSCFGQEHLYYNCIKIFISGEQQTPDFNVCDYAVGFDFINFGDRYFRLPLMYQTKYICELNRLSNIEYYGQDFCKRKFCSFVYSNKESDDIRELIFNELSKYKKVDSGGKIANNLGYRVENKLSHESNYKFSIACENVSYPGYLTEKIMQSFAAGCVPIYWGDPKVFLVFNKKSFINIQDFVSLEEAVEYIKKIDQDDQLYLNILNQPKLNNDFQVEIVHDLYKEFVYNIFDQDIQKAARNTRHFWNKFYNVNLKRRNNLYRLLEPFIDIRRKLKGLTR